MPLVPYDERIKDHANADTVYLVKDGNDDIELKTIYLEYAKIRSQDLYDCGEQPKIEVWKKVKTIIPKDNFIE